MNSRVQQLYKIRTRQCRSSSFYTSCVVPPPIVGRHRPLLHLHETEFDDARNVKLLARCIFCTNLYVPHRSEIIREFLFSSIGSSPTRTHVDRTIGVSSRPPPPATANTSVLVQVLTMFAARRIVQLGKNTALLTHDE